MSEWVATQMIENVLIVGSTTALISILWSIKSGIFTPRSIKYNLQVFMMDSHGSCITHNSLILQFKIRR